MQKFTVLLADDHAVIRQGLKQILDDTDDLVVTGQAANGNELMQLIREGRWDILILDMSMPGRNGPELIRLVKEEQPALPILVLSMHHEEQYAVRALQAGASGYLTKETDTDILIEALREIIRGGVYVTPKVAALMVRGIRPQTEHLPHDLLSDREFQVFNMIVAGKGLTEIAADLSLSVKTVSTHKTHILDKLGLSNVAELVRYAMTHGLGQSSNS